MIARLQKHTPLYIVAGVLILVALFLLFQTLNPKEPDWVTAIVEKGEVSETVSISGFIEAKNTAQLAFPTVGKITEVFVKEGQEVEEGEVLATLASTQLVAERNQALAALKISQAQYDKLVSGVSSEVKVVSETNVKNAQQELERVINVEAQKVENARKTLLSSNLSAIAKDINEDSVPPVITGSYTCDDEGTYTLTLYSSNAKSGFSYRLSGLETGSAQAGTEQSAPLGVCGLYIQFSNTGGYNGSQWTVAVPNTQSESYISNVNAYSLALTQQANNVAAAEDARALSVEKANEVTADPRNEELREAQAGIESARARISAIDAQIDDRSVVAPFDGMVTDISILKGETAPTSPVITLLASDAFELKARIPEIDITKLAVSQSATAVFDAAPNEIQQGIISYISPLATLIDGVAYFEATIQLTSMPLWIKSGLNADVDIIVQKKENVLRIPKRFLIESEDGTYAILLPNGTKTITQKVQLEFSGNDGYVAIIGLNIGDTVIAP